MNPIEAIGSGFSQYANFSGRARRSEYWWFIGFVYLSLICLSLIPILGALFYLAGVRGSRTHLPRSSRGITDLKSLIKGV